MYKRYLHLVLNYFEIHQILRNKCRNGRSENYFEIHQISIRKLKVAMAGVKIISKFTKYREEN